MLLGTDFEGLGEAKPKKDPPTVPPPLPTPVPVKNAAMLPKWLPAAVGAAGVGIVIMLLVTGKE